MRNIENLIATRFEFKEDLNSQVLHVRVVHPIIYRCTSQFYEGERWSVRLMDGLCLNKSGEWEDEPTGGKRNAEFYSRCRFETFVEAIAALNVAEQRQAEAQQKIDADVEEALSVARQEGHG